MGELTQRTRKHFGVGDDDRGETSTGLRWLTFADPRLGHASTIQFLLSIVFWLVMIAGGVFQVVAVGNVIWRVLSAIVTVLWVALLGRIVRDFVRHLQTD